MKITCEYRGQKTQFEFPKGEIIVGRSGAGGADLKLDFDTRVSRRHARIWVVGTRFWISDLESSAGTRVNGNRINDNVELKGADRVQVGETVLLVENSIATGDNLLGVGEAKPVIDELSISSAHDADVDPSLGGDVEIRDRRDSQMPSSIQVPGTNSEMQNRLQLLYDLPIELAMAPSQDILYERILDAVVRIIPGAERGALLVLDRLSNKLVLQASVPADSPPISRTLVKRAAAEGQGFIWTRSGDEDPSKSIAFIGMQTGMYAPLMWQGEVLGVMCVDNPHRKTAFSVDDLDFLIAVTHYSAAAVSNRILQFDLRHYIEVQKRLMTNFSEKLRAKIVDQARSGQLKTGGEKSMVTVMISDLRGFTRASADMTTEQVVAMLNEYFSAQTEAIFRNGGTVDKFIGDAVLAVFGSPEPDEDQILHAVQAAIEVQAAVSRVNEARKKRGDKICECGIGLHQGEVLHGFIGAENRLEFTVIGDAVNKASRISDGAGPAEILVSPALHEAVKNRFDFKKSEIETKHEGTFEVWSLQVNEKLLATQPFTD